jgi:hypothetical protein
LELFDVEAAFLNSELDTEVYIEWPEGMVELGFITPQEKEEYCIRLTKAMYGNIDSPLRWMKTFANFLKNVLKLEQSKSDPCIFYKKVQGKVVLILGVYVDDTLVCGTKKETAWAYRMIETRFKIDKLGKLNKHLGVWWIWKTDGNGEPYLVATMPKMVEEIVEKYNNNADRVAKNGGTPGFPGKTLKKNEGKTVKMEAYRSIVGKIMYYTTKIAPELSNAVRELAGHLSNPSEEHWKALERCVGYIQHEHHSGLAFRRPRELRSISDCDSDYANSDDRKSITGRVNTVGGMITNWSSKKQGTVALSSTEAEYNGLSECAQESMFTQSLIFEVTGVLLPAIIYEDNIGAIYLVRNQQVSCRTKHIDIRHHYLRDLRDNKRLDIRFKRSEDNASDIMTKNTPRAIHFRHTKSIRSGTLTCWREDVKSDPSVTLRGMPDAG